MKLSFAKGCSYYVVGLGKSGRSAAEALSKSGATVYVWDDQADGQRYAAEKKFPLLKADEVPWGDITALILSPGIPHLYPAPHESAVHARQHGVPILCDVDLFFQAQPKGSVIGVTGTNGKSTTTALISHCLNEAGLNAQGAGNIGAPVLEVCDGDASTTTVLELSSYQLERTPHLALDVAVHLNLTPDHLTRHGGMEGYRAAKRSIFQRAKLAFVGVDDDPSQRIYDALEIPSNALDSKKAFSGKRLLSEGLFYQQGSFVERSHSGKDSQPLFTDEILPPSLRGPHNIQNVLAAYGACVYLGMSLESFIEGLKSFQGLAHRQEIILTKEGVTFVNDSKATNVVSTAQALQTFEDIFWIAGGQSKEDSLTDLAPFFPKIRKAYLIGQAMNAFATQINHVEPPVVFEKCHTLDAAVAAAYRDARQVGKGTVLLAPACASFDQFKSFEERGDVFRRLVVSLGQERSQKPPMKEAQ